MFVVIAFNGGNVMLMVVVLFNFLIILSYI